MAVAISFRISSSVVPVGLTVTWMSTRLFGSVSVGLATRMVNVCAPFVSKKLRRLDPLLVYCFEIRVSAEARRFTSSVWVPSAAESLADTVNSVADVVALLPWKGRASGSVSVFSRLCSAESLLSKSLTTPLSRSCSAFFACSSSLGWLSIEMIALMSCS